MWDIKPGCLFESIHYNDLKGLVIKRFEVKFNLRDNFE